jgi:hypothetical protein
MMPSIGSTWLQMLLRPVPMVVSGFGFILHHKRGRDHSAFATTRRRQLQLFSMDQRKSLKRRACLPVCSASAYAAANSTLICATGRSLRGKPNR